MAGDYTHGPEIPDPVKMDETLRMGNLVEPLGFDSIWTTEHYGSAYSMQPNPLQWLAYWAGRPSGSTWARPWWWSRGGTRCAWPTRSPCWTSSSRGATCCWAWAGA